MTADVSWGPANPGGEHILCITVGGETFVRPDWNAYAMGYSACKDDARRMVRERCQCGHDGDSHCYCDALVSELIPAIDALPPKDEGIPDD
jgi:hypothetical protein